MPASSITYPPSKIVRASAQSSCRYVRDTGCKLHPVLCKFLLGELVTVHWLLLAVNDKPFMGMAATGASVRCPGFEVNRIRAGRILEVWRLSDTFSLMQQLKAI